MPKKAKIKYMSHLHVTVDVICPHCKEVEYHEYYNIPKGEQEECGNCGKIYLVTYEKN
jgi:uncharacterized protein (DUF983 family)